MMLRRGIWVIVVLVLAVVGFGGAALFFWGGKPTTEGADQGLRGELAWETEVRLHATVVVAADENSVVVRSSAVSSAVDVSAVDLDTGDEVLRDRAELFSGIGLHNGRVVFVQEGSGDVVSHDLGQDERWTYSGTNVLAAQLTPAGVVVLGPEVEDVRVLDPETGGVLWERLGLGRPMVSDATTTLIRADGQSIAYDTFSGDELWRVSSAPRVVMGRSPATEVANVFVLQDERALVGYEPRSGDVLWEYPVDTGDSSFVFFHAPEENLILECVAGTTTFTVRTIDDRSGEVLASVSHDPQASLVGYNKTSFVIALGEPAGGCIAMRFEPPTGPLEGYGLRDGEQRWRLDGDAVDLVQPASRGADDRPGALRVDVVRLDGSDGGSPSYFFATTGEEIAIADDASAVDVVAGELVITTVTEETVTVTLTEPEVTVSGSKGIDGTATVYAVRGGLLVLAGTTLALVR